MRRRFLQRLLSLLAACAMGLIGTSRVVQSQEVAPLQDQLEKGLKARLPSEFEFIETVATMVENGTLPRDLVDKIFFYVRRTRGHKKYLVPFFERLLRAKAAELGINIP